MKNTACILGFLKNCSAGAAVLLLPAIATGLAPAATPIAAASELQSNFRNSPKVVLDEAWQLVHQEYVDGDFNRVDWLGVRQTLLSGEYTTRDAAYSELRRVLRRLEDPYTRFLNPAQYSALTEQTSGEVSGIGLRLAKEGQNLVVSSILDNSPAKQSGIAPGDIVLIIDGRAGKNLTVEGAAQLIRGESGSKLSITVRRKKRQRRNVRPRSAGSFSSNRSV